MSDPVRTTNDYFVADADILRLLGLKAGYVVAIVRKSGHVYGPGGKAIGQLTLGGWQVTVIKP